MTTPKLLYLKLGGFEKSLDFAAKKVMMSAKLIPGMNICTKEAIRLPTKKERIGILSGML